MKVAVVTPSIGSRFLNDCVKSVLNQTYQDLTHYIFVDGYEYRKPIFDTCNDSPEGKIKFVILEENVGKGWYGHRVYSACSFLVNADVICYLDEDNFIEPNHVERLVAKLEEGNQWAYSLRKIYDRGGNYVCEDNCESLGKWPVYFNDKTFHIDTSSFAVRRDIAVRVGHAWYGQWGADRQFFNALKQIYPTYDCTNEYSLCYRLDANPNSVNKEFFDKGNQVSIEKYGDKFPWLEKTKLERTEQVGPGISIVL